MHEDQQLLRVMIRQLADEVEVQAFYRVIDDTISELTDQGEIRELQQIVDEIRELRKTQYLENGLIFNAGVWDGHSGGRSISIVRRSDFVMSQNATSPSPPAPPPPSSPSSPSPSPSPPSADEDDAWYYGLLIPAGIIVPLLVVRHLSS